MTGGETPAPGLMAGVRVATTAGRTPVVVFLNGLGETLDFWHPVVERLFDLATFSYDRPPRDPTAGNGDLEAEVAEIDELLGWITDPVILVGHSFGGLLAEAYARARPERVAGLVLVDATVPEEYAESGGTDAPAAAGAGLPVLGRVRTMIDAAILSGRARPVWKFLLPWAMVGLGSSLSTRGVLAVLPSEFSERLSSPGHLARAMHDNRNIGRYCRELVELRAQEALPPIPIEVAVGRLGPWVWRREQKAWVAAQRAQLGMLGDDVTMTVLDSAHMVMLDRPDELAEIIRNVHAEVEQAEV